jgi:hypothetical protein
MSEHVSELLQEMRYKYPQPHAKLSFTLVSSGSDLISHSSPTSLNIFLHITPMPSPSYTAFPSDADLFYFCTTSSTSAEHLNVHYAPPSKSSLKIGVVILSQDPTQLLDLSSLDLLAMMGRSRISNMDTSVAVQDEAVDEIDIRYITASGEGSFPVTSGARMPVTVS